MNIQLVFNLNTVLDGLFLPAANLVQMDEKGELTHFIQRATLSTMAPYEIECDEPVRNLLLLAEKLAPKIIEEKFRPQRAKTSATLKQLWENPQARPQVELYIHRQLDAFLREVFRLKFPVTLDADRRTLGKDVLIKFDGQEYQPVLSFCKTDQGIDYRLKIAGKNEILSIRERNIIPLTNTEPAWLLAGFDVLRVSGINGNMVKPFLQKDIVHIPSDKTKIYFRQFIAKNVHRTRIEAEGFEMRIENNLHKVRLDIIENVLEKYWLIQPVFLYEGAEFAYADNRQNKTEVRFLEDSEDGVVIAQTQRNLAAEEALLEPIAKTSLKKEGRFFRLPEQDNLEDYIVWVATHRQFLESAQIFPASPLVDGKNIALELGAITVRAESQNDWFDIQGEVKVGKTTFPFYEFVPFLRSGDRYFPLPDGTFFLIPEVWFSRYSDLAGLLQEGVGNSLQLPKTLFTVVQQAGINEGGLPEIDLDSIDYTPSSSLQAELRPYQLKGVKWLVGHRMQGFGACLADDMGLGKTLQTIAVLLHAKEQRDMPLSPLPETAEGQLNIFASHRQELRPLNALLIMPASLVFNWQKELQKFAPVLFVYQHTGTKRLRDLRAIASHDIVLTTYHTAKQDLALLSAIQWHYLVLDESQNIKNHRSEISTVVRALRGDHKITLSGTPIENSLADLWAQMEFINPDTLGDFKNFKTKFILPIEKRSDLVAKEKLFNRVRPYFLRRTKEEVAPDLPALSEQIFYSEMTAEQRKRYEEIKSAVRNEILALFDNPQTRIQALQALTRLRQLANHPVLVDADYSGASGKFDDVMSQWDILSRSGHKVLVFSSFEKHLRLFRQTFEKENRLFAWLTGDTAAEQRPLEVAKFQKNPAIQTFFMTIKAGGVGLNLTAADYVFLLDPWWNPAVEAQAIARAHRIGQEKPVTVLRFISRETIEEKILKLQEHKRLLGEGLFELSPENPSLSRQDLEELLD